jgi:hypothetical protein
VGDVAEERTMVDFLTAQTHSRPILAESTSKNEYIPLYFYDKDGCYRHESTQLIATAVVPLSNPIGSPNRPH